VSLWLLGLVWFGLRWAAQPASWLWLVGTGLSLGLALLTKATAFVYGFPICVLLGIAALRTGGARLGLARGTIVLLLALALNLGTSRGTGRFMAAPVAPGIGSARR